MKKRLLLASILCTHFGFAQQTDSLWTAKDTLTATVRAYESNRPVSTVPAAISVVDKPMLQRFTNTSFVSAVNTLPGVRMEERSPGSYRLNMRGSSLRAPFGIQNIKMYLNDIPLTDPGGNTYLNQLDFRNVSSLEILKGPASSLYGAGSGGAVLINTQPNNFEKGIELGAQGGSYGLFAVNGSISFGNPQANNKVYYSHQQSGGWREHTAMRRDVAGYENKIRVSDRQTIKTILHYTDLYYQTPGALTLAQYTANPRGARPAAGIFPSAEQAKAAIYQKTFIAGFTNDYTISNNWKNTTSVYGAASWFNNPTFRLYEKRTEPHFGGRTVFSNDFGIGNHFIHLIYGTEAQKGIFTSRTSKIKNGLADTALTSDEISNWRYSVFTQAEWIIPQGWSITGGLSYNKSYVGIQRLMVYPVTTQTRTFNSEFSPRIALMKNFKQVNIYGSISKGFSPPTTSELLPGTGEINTTLQAEQGTNYEVGIKSNFINQKLNIELSVYNFNLTNTITQRRDAGGGDYYTNAGKTKQQGAELFTKYNAITKPNKCLSSLQFFGSYTYNRYRFADYKLLEEDYSGKELPGIPTHNITVGVDASTKQGVYTNLTWQFVDKIAMDDANSQYAAAYRLLSARVGWRIKMRAKTQIDLFVAGDNLLDNTYSLGNDINAAANRFYNAAAKRNFASGIQLKWK
jgi:iron complex outermembrane receptor protein